MPHLDDEQKPDGVENEAVEQISFADKIILNKVDLVPEAAEREAIKKRIRQINPGALIFETERAKVPLDLILDQRCFDLDRMLTIDENFLADESHQHDVTTGSVGIRHAGDFDLTKLNEWMGAFLKTQGASIYRMKGILAIAGTTRRFVFQGVHMLFDGEPQQQWGPNEVRESKVVFIGKNLNRAEITAGLLSCAVASC